MTTTNDTTPAATAPLFERIGGRAALERVVPDVVQAHLDNPLVGHRFRAAKKPVPELTRLAIEFFATGLSGVPSYDGLSLPDAHAGMNIDEAEFVAVLDDILGALQKHGMPQQEQAELLYILYGMKSDIVGR